MAGQNGKAATEQRQEPIMLDMAIVQQVMGAKDLEIIRLESENKRLRERVAELEAVTVP